jgi:hypothetical protein
MNEIQFFLFICQTDKFIIFYYRCDSHATKDFTRFDWIIHDHVIHELYRVVPI